VCVLIITTEKITAGGDCIARFNAERPQTNDSKQTPLSGKVVFIPDSLPGETLEVELVEEKRDYARAKIIRVLKPSPHRIKPPCPLYGVCGGCNMQTADYAYQLELKKMILHDAFTRVGFLCEENENIKNERSLPPITVISGSPWDYRSRIQLHTKIAPNDNVVTGFMARGSNDIISVNDCPAVVPRLREYLASTSLSTSASALLPVFPEPVEGSSRRALSRHVTEKRFNLCVCYASEGGADNEIIAGDDAAAGDTFMPLLDERIYFAQNGFFQSNMPLFKKLIHRVCESLEIDAEKQTNGSTRQQGNALDLYSGCGVFAHFLSKKFSAVYLVEENEAALSCARDNVSDVYAFAMSGKRWVQQKEARLTYDAVVADPPRSGLEKEVRDWLCTSTSLSTGVSRPQELRYVSCDPVTLARDAVHLVAAGYRLTSLELFDFYPQTSHIETLACFTHHSK
jgi:23S rRNA (uracil1939-C5)-methyltransferase